MNDNQRKKFTTVQSLLGVFSDFESKISLYPKLASTVEELSKMIEALRKADVVLTVDPTANTIEKRAMKEKMAVLASELAAAGAACAADSNNVVLEKTLSISYSDVRYGTDEEAAAITEVIIDGLNSIAQKILSEYMVDKTDIKELQNLVDGFDDISARKSSTKSQRVATTKQLKTLFEETNILLEKIDRLMKRIQRKELELYNAFINARQIIG